MEARTHVPFGAACGLGYAWLSSLHGLDAAVVGAVSALASTTPDVCATGWWRSLDRWLPDEWLGWGGPLQHRGLTHWWAIPAAGWFLALPQATGYAHLLLAAVLIGIASHLVGDAVFGKGGYGRGPGVPLAPWSHHVGLALDCGGATERWLIRPLLLVGLVPAAYVVIFGGSL